MQREVTPGRQWGQVSREVAKEDICGVSSAVSSTPSSNECFKDTHSLL